MQRKILKNLSMEGTLIKFALKKITMIEWRITGTLCYPNPAQIQIVRGIMFPNWFNLNFIWQMRVCMAKNLAKILFHFLFYFYFSITADIRYLKFYLNLQRKLGKWKFGSIFDLENIWSTWWNEQIIRRTLSNSHTEKRKIK